LSKEITTVSEKLRGFVKVGSVNCDIEDNESLCDIEEVTEHPQINIYIPAPADDGSKGVIKKARVGKCQMLIGYFMYITKFIY